MISCLIVNFNCLDYTRKLVQDVINQSYQDFDLLIVDQNSHEVGTEQFLSSFSGIHNIKVVRNSWNRPLNHIWNDFARDAKGKYLAFLNNDITIPPNFLSDTVAIFDKHHEVACVVHPTNHPNWGYYTPNELTYEILDEPVRQGWDFSYRACDWSPIPEILEFYCGDDYVFENVYHRGMKVAMATSSPIIHWLSQTRKSPLNPVIPNRNPNRDIDNYKKLGLVHRLGLIERFSNVAPTLQRIIRKE